MSTLSLLKATNNMHCKEGIGKSGSSVWCLQEQAIYDSN